MSVDIFVKAVARVQCHQNFCEKEFQSEVEVSLKEEMEIDRVPSTQTVLGVDLSQDDAPGGWTCHWLGEYRFFCPEHTPKKKNGVSKE